MIYLILSQRLIWIPRIWIKNSIKIQFNYEFFLTKSSRPLHFLSLHYNSSIWNTLKTKRLYSSWNWHQPVLFQLLSAVWKKRLPIHHLNLPASKTIPLFTTTTTRRRWKKSWTPRPRLRLWTRGHIPESIVPCRSGESGRTAVQNVTGEPGIQRSSYKTNLRWLARVLCKNTNWLCKMPYLLRTLNLSCSIQ